MTTAAPITDATVARYALEIDLKATPQDVWDALTDDIGRWWPGPFFMCDGPGPRNMSLDARPGGHMYENAGGGNGMIWGTVIHVQRGKVLELTGSYGSPLTWGRQVRARSPRRRHPAALHRVVVRACDRGGDGLQGPRLALPLRRLPARPPRWRRATGLAGRPGPRLASQNPPPQPPERDARSPATRADCPSATAVRSGSSPNGATPGSNGDWGIKTDCVRSAIGKRSGRPYPACPKP